MVDPSRLTVQPDKLRADMPALAAVHDAVKAGLEQAREAKALGSSLQCSVVIVTEDAGLTATLQDYMDELDAMYVVSHVDLNTPLPEERPWCYSKPIELHGDQKGTVHVLPPKQAKCSRCWRYVAEEDDGICGRCEEVVAATN